MKKNRQPGSPRFIHAIIYSVSSRITQQLTKSDSWKLTSTGTQIQEYVDKFSLLTIFSDFPLARKIKKKKQTTFTTHPPLEFALASQFTLNGESQKLSHDQHFQGNTRNKMNTTEFKISLHLSFNSS